MSASTKRENDGENLHGDSKRPRIEEEKDAIKISDQTEKTSEHEHILPPSHSLLGVPLPVAVQGRAINFRETDVGISEYVGKGVSKIEGIIKQRYV